MTVAPVRPVITGVHTLLTGNGLNVLPGGAGNAVPPCVVLWGGPGMHEGSSLGTVDDLLDVEITTVACGVTVDQSLWIADKITAVLNRAVLSIPGRKVHPIVLASVAPVTRDDTLSVPVFGAALRWRILSQPI